MDMTPGPPLLVARRGPPLRTKIKNWKKNFLDLKQKYETRRKGINTSQLANRNFNDNIWNIWKRNRKTYEYTLLFTFMWFFLKTKTFQAHFCKKQFVIQFVETCSFPTQLINLENVFNVCSVHKQFYVK